MKQNEGSTIDWNQLESLPDSEIAVLVDAATSVLEWSAAEEGVGSVREMPPAAMTRELQGQLTARGIEENGAAARQIVRPQTARPMAMLLLQHIAQEPALAAHVQEVYRERKRLLVVDPATVAAVALLILMLKLKRIKLGKTEIDLEMLSADALNSVFGFLGRPVP